MKSLPDTDAQRAHYDDRWGRETYANLLQLRRATAILDGLRALNLREPKYWTLDVEQAGSRPFWPVLDLPRVLTFHPSRSRRRKPATRTSGLSQPIFPICKTCTRVSMSWSAKK